jgi:TetR/AcrR family transcriptional regulator, transcriptional repressor for nem operon
MARHKEFDRSKALDRAMNLFWCRGYEATSIQDLVEHMGINRGSLYDTFGDKASLYREALDRYEQVMGEQIREKLMQPGSAKAAIRAAFETVVASAAADTQRRGCMMVNATIEMVPHYPEVATTITNNAAQSEAAFREVLLRGQQTGEINRRHDPSALARFLINNLQGLRVLSKSMPDGSKLQEVVDVMLSALD